MKNKNLVLIRTLLNSTSQSNAFKYCRDSKKRGKIIGNWIGYGILYLMLMAYCILTCIGYGKLGITDVIPGLTAVTIGVLSFFMTLFKANGYLFNFKDYDMLMALPFKVKDVAGCRCIYMYLKDIPWYAGISLAMMIGYGVYAEPHFLTYPVWIVLSVMLPIIPMLAAAFVGFLIAKIGSGFKKKNLVQIVLTFAFLFLVFALRFIIEEVFKLNKVNDMLLGVSDIMKSIEKIYIPAGWFRRAVTEISLIDMILLIAVSLVLFEVIFFPVGKSYRKINSSLMSHGTASKFSMKNLKKRSVVQAVAYKEFRRMIGPTVYVTNAAVGEVLCFGAGVAVLFINIDQLIVKITSGAPVTKEMLFPAIPIIVYLLVGMVSTTAISPSLEGKNYWIVESLPINRKQLYQGKMLFNMYLTVPFLAFTIICISIAAKVPPVNTVLYLVLGIILCGFSTVCGLISGIRFMKLDWENEVEAVKQGAAVAVYMFPNLFVTVGLIVLVVALGRKIDQNLITVSMIIIMAIVTLLCYKKAIKLAESTN